MPVEVAYRQVAYSSVFKDISAWVIPEGIVPVGRPFERNGGTVSLVSANMEITGTITTSGEPSSIRTSAAV